MEIKSRLLPETCSRVIVVSLSFSIYFASRSTSQKSEATFLGRAVRASIVKSYLILLFVSLLFPSCGGSDAENRPSNADSSSTQKFTPEELRQISSLPSDKIEAMKEALLKEGLYDCCMKPGCTLCISQDQRCDCYLDIARKDPIARISVEILML